MSLAVSVLLLIVAVVSLASIVLLVRGARTERRYREKAEKFRLVLDSAPMMIWTARPDTTLDYLNRTCSQFTGLSLEKLLNEGWLEVVHPEDLDHIRGVYEPAIEARLPFTMEYRVRRTDGAWRWLFAIGVPRFGAGGAFEGFVGCDIDVTERKDAEARILESSAELEESHREIQMLTGRLIRAQDAERARIARDLHDDVSQQLAGMSIALSGLRHRLDGLSVGKEVLEDLRFLHERTTALGWNVRHLSHDLHPTVLRHSGLVAALSSYCGDIQRLHGTTANFVAEGEFGSLSPEASLSLYRIAQEGLRNVIAHADARQVEVRLFGAGGHAELTISDDGRGFDVDSSLTRGKGLGLVSIAERVRLVEGTIEITSKPGKGCCVRVRVPARAA